MPKRTTEDDKPLNIPSFLTRPRTPDVPAEPREEDVDAVMASVMQAAGLAQASDPHEEADALPKADAPHVAAQEPDQGAAAEARSKAEAVPGAEAEPKQDAERSVESEPEAEKPKEEPEPEEPQAVLAPTPRPESGREPDPAEPTEDEGVPQDAHTLDEDLKAFDRIERRLFAHRYAAAELEAFGETIDPAKATADRSEALATLAEEDHELLSAPEVGPLVKRLTRRTDELDPMVAAQVRVFARDRHLVVSVSPTDQARLVRLTTQAYDAWRDARAHDDWRSFAPYLDRIVSLRRKIARAQNPDADPYDTMLDQHEPGTNRAFYNSFFATLKRCVVPLLSSISMSGRQLNDTCVQGRFDEGRQWELARDIARLEGIDEDAHYLTSTVHPFSEAMTSNYAVTACHVEPENLMANVYTMLHEVGHGLYEQGVDPRFNRTSLKGGTSMGMHEAQSRLFENYIGRDRAFVGPLLDLMKRRFPGQLGRVTPNQLYQAVNRVSPTLIRVDADELTYPLHILVRYEIEQLLMSGNATAREVPMLWSERYHKYIGANVPNDTLGALQDVHWAHGEFGYFPAYALGNAYAAQLRAKMIDEGMDWSGLLAAGDLAPIRAWLGDRVWRHGRSKDPAQIMQDACGEPFDPSHYAEYLTNKYSALYNLR